MVKTEKDKQTKNSTQDTTFKTKFKTKQHEPHQKLGVISYKIFCHNTPFFLFIKDFNSSNISKSSSMTYQYFKLIFSLTNALSTYSINFNCIIAGSNCFRGLD